MNVMKKREVARFRSDDLAPMSFVNPRVEFQRVSTKYMMVDLCTLCLGITNITTVQTIEKVEKGQHRKKENIELSIQCLVNGLLLCRPLDITCWHMLFALHIEKSFQIARIDLGLECLGIVSIGRHG